MISTTFQKSGYNNITAVDLIWHIASAIQMLLKSPVQAKALIRLPEIKNGEKGMIVSTNHIHKENAEREFRSAIKGGII